MERKRKRKKKKKPSNRDPYNIKKLLASSHALHACDESYSFFLFFLLVVLFCRKKKLCFLFYIYNFYFENIIYK